MSNLATPDVVEAVMGQLGCGKNHRGDCRILFHDSGWTDRGCPVAVPVADAAARATLQSARDALAGQDADATAEALGFRQDTGYGVIVADTILMSTYDGTAKKHTRWMGLTPWVEVES